NGGTVDFTGSTAFGLHFAGAGAGVTVNPGVNDWVGDGASRIQNDTNGPLTISLLGNSSLNVGVILSGGGSNPNFILSNGIVRLSNTQNSANITASNFGEVITNDLSTDLGGGAFGTLGTGTFTLNGTTFRYDGQTATSAKPLALALYSAIHVAHGNVNLTLTGPISGAGSLVVYGTLETANSSTLTLAGTNTYAGPTYVQFYGTLAVPTIGNAGAGGTGSPIGSSSNAASNLQLGYSDFGRGTLLLTGTASAYGTDRGVTVGGMYADGYGGAIGVQNAATTLTWSGPITGTGSFIKTGAGTLVLANAANTYTGGTYVEGGRLTLGSGTAIPTGGNVTIAAGAEFNTAGFGNSQLTTAGTVALNGGTFRVPPGSGDYYLNQLQMTGGTVDFTGTSNFGLLLTGPGAGVTVNDGTSTNTWAGDTARVRNATSNSLSISVNGNALLNAAAILSSGANNQTFVVSGFGGVRLLNTGNTANITNRGIVIYSNDLSTDVGFGAFGTLGTGAITLSDGGSLEYDGATATTAKPLAITNFGNVRVGGSGTNLTMTGVISGPGAGLGVEGGYFDVNTGPGPRTLTLTAANTYSGRTFVGGNVILAIPNIANAGGGGVNSPLGASSNAANNLLLGDSGSRGTLLLTGTDAAYSTDRGLTVFGLYVNPLPYYNGAGGAIGVQNAGTTLTWNGPIVNSSVAYPGSLIKTGAGTLVLANAANSFTGGTYVEAGRLTLGSATALPAGGSVTVFSGAELNTAGMTIPRAAALGAVNLQGGTIRVPTGSPYVFMNQINVSPLGGSIDMTGTSGSTGFVLTGSGAGVTVNANSTWAGPISGYIGNGSDAELPFVIAPDVTLTSDLSLAPSGNVQLNSTRLSGGGTLYLRNVPQYVAALTVDHARLRLDDLTGVGPLLALTLDAGTLAYGGPTASSSAAFALGAGGSTVEVVNAATTLTLTGAISGTGSATLTKTGPGTLALTNPSNTYLGGLTVNAGRLDVSDDAQLGLANPTVNPAGTLRYTASATTARTFTVNGGTLEAPAGVTLTLNGAAVNGGFLRGAGTFALTGGTALSGTSTLTSTTVTQTGPASVANFSNGGAFTVGAGQTLTWNGGTNTSSGRLTVNGTVNATDFVSNGLLTVNPGGLLTHGGSDLVLGGGSTTFVGSVASPGGKIDLGGQQLVVRGGLLVTNAGSFGSGNGVRNGTTVADYGALVKGTGPYDAILTRNGGQYLPGNSPGTSQVGTFNLNGGGTLVFQISDAGPSLSFPAAAGTAGNNPGWGLTQVFTALNFTATPANRFTVQLQTQLPPPSAPDTLGPMASFDPTRPYSWLVFDLQPGAAFTGTFDPSAISFNAGQFANPTLGGGFALARGGGQVFVTFTPVPEPTFVLAASFGSLLLGRRFIRRLGSHGSKGGVDSRRVQDRIAPQKGSP
ncbi:MAG TPA: autotransporter-associated beta strand repeat-containing protein, partial [Gemmataceae bacterium]